jgi:hypothetical protein
MSHQELIEMLLNAGFDTGWALAGEELTIWEHEADPPAPLTRPEATDETPTAD